MFVSVKIFYSIASRLFSLLGLVCLLLFSSIPICPSAEAILRQHHETTGLLRYHTQHSLQDKQGNAWQVVLFPETKAEGTTKYYLRLVGFPGIVEFVHPQSLEILTSEGKILIASDVFIDRAPANNVGQYDVTEILAQLPEAQLKLSVPLKGDRSLSLQLPKAIAIEWQWLMRSQDTFQTTF
jgi:Protein of unknown function (DUF3122)